jgi:hypothetical protein
VTPSGQELAANGPGVFFRAFRTGTAALGGGAVCRAFTPADSAVFVFGTAAKIERRLGGSSAAVCGAEDENFAVCKP